MAVTCIPDRLFTAIKPDEKGRLKGITGWFGWTLLLLPTPLWVTASSSNSGLSPMFIPNQGQWPPAVCFEARSGGLAVRFQKDRAVMAFPGAEVEVEYAGSNPGAGIEGAARMEGHANYLLGDDPRKWRTGVPLYAGVRYRDLYPGIDLVYGGDRRRLKSEFRVAPGADPARIAIVYRGARRIVVELDGSLSIETAGGALREAPPELYQETPNGRRRVEGSYRVSGTQVRFAVGGYDRRRELIIDPTLSYSTFFGGGGIDRASAVAVDTSGNAYVAGYTDSSSLAPSSSLVWGGGVDAFVFKLNSSGSTVVYATFLGGSGDDRAFAIAVDASGNAYVGGWTGSANFPSQGGYQTFSNGGRDGFVAKLNSTGTALVWATYLGGSGTDSVNGIAVNTAGNAYVTGVTASDNFPKLSPYQAARAGLQDAFVTKLNTSGSALVYSTFLGGSNDDRGASIAIDSAGNAYVGGTTRSTNFPVASPAQPTSGGGQDAFVAKLNAAGSALTWSTYIGGVGTEFVEAGNSLALDSSGAAYIAGNTTSQNFPVLNAAQPIYNGGANDAFLVKLSAAGARVYATYLGGNVLDNATAVAVDSSNRAYVAGYTNSPDFPIAGATQSQLAGNWDAFLTRYAPAGGSVEASTFHGGAEADAAYGVAIDTLGRVYIVGQTGSGNFPLAGAAQGPLNGSVDAFVARFSFSSASEAASVSPSSGSGAQQVFTVSYTHSAGAPAIDTLALNVAATQSLVTACAVRYTQASNVLELFDDAGAATVGQSAPGSPGALGNSQCLLDAGASSVVASGPTLTLRLALTFRPQYAGAKTLSVQSSTAGGGLGAWQSLGNWTATAPASGLTVVPAAGSGASGTFTIFYTDPAGAANIGTVSLNANSALVSFNACYIRYIHSSHWVELLNDGNSGWVGNGIPGTAGAPPLANSQCSLRIDSSAYSVSGNTLTLTLSIDFSPSYSGTRNLYVLTSTAGGDYAPWVAAGSWTVTAPPGVAAMPLSGSGYQKVFAISMTDPAGVSNIGTMALNFNSVLVSSNACYVRYDRATNQLRLLNDANTGWIGAAPPGLGVQRNSQCLLDLAGSSVVVSGSTLTLRLAITFQVAYAGAKNLYFQSMSAGGVFAAWQALGTWTVTTPPNGIAAVPVSGSGSSQTFTLFATDPAGASNLASVALNVNAALVSANACYVLYTRASNRLELLNDSNSGWAGSLTPGTPGLEQNSQCILDVGASAVAVTGNTLTLHLAIAFKPPYVGARKLYTSSTTVGGAFSGWTTPATWTVTSP